MAGESGEGGEPGGGTGGPTRSLREGAPTTEGEAAARRLIAGHLDTSDLDPTTARAVQLLTAADVLAAEEYRSQRRRRFADPFALTVVLAMICLVLLSLGYLNQIRRNHESDKARATLVHLVEENQRLSQQIASCTTPGGECAKQGQRAQAEAIATIVQQITDNACRIANLNNSVGYERCVAAVLVARQATPAPAPTATP